MHTVKAYQTALQSHINCERSNVLACLCSSSGLNVQQTHLVNSGCRSELLQKVHANTRQLQDDMIYPRRPAKGQRVTSDQIHAAVRDTNVELITTMLEALEQEHEFL